VTPPITSDFREAPPPPPPVGAGGGSPLPLPPPPPLTPAPQLKQRLEKEELEKCSFRPAINPSGVPSRIVRGSGGVPAPSAPRRVFNSVGDPSVRVRSYEEVDREVQNVLQKEGECGPRRPRTAPGPARTGALAPRPRPPTAGAVRAGPGSRGGLGDAKTIFHSLPDASAGDATHHL